MIIRLTAELALLVRLFGSFTLGLIWQETAPEDRAELPVEVIAYECGMELSDFLYFAQVVEAESDRTPETTAGKVAIAAVILNRVNSSDFPDTVRGVLDQSGQFSTTHNGYCSIQATQSSCWAIYEALEAIDSGELPSSLLYFNCIGYQYGEPYGYIGGNYFSTA